MKKLNGYEVKLFSRFPIANPQHYYEVFDLVLAAAPPQYRMGDHVDQYLSDAELLYPETGETRRIERDRSTESYIQIGKRIIEKYSGCNDVIYWVMDTNARVEGALRKCNPPTNHWFSTYREAIANFHGDHWRNIASLAPAQESGNASG